MAEHLVPENKGKSNITWRVVDDEALILDLSSGYYFSLNPIATEIWQSLQSGANIPDVVQSISLKYDIDKTIVEKDLDELMIDLRSCKLLD
jgi:hypothetical protein